MLAEQVLLVLFGLLEFALKLVGLLVEHVLVLRECVLLLLELPGFVRLHLDNGVLLCAEVNQLLYLDHVLFLVVLQLLDLFLKGFALFH
jgi:hypothetical protein